MPRELLDRSLELSSLRDPTARTIFLSPNVEGQGYGAYGYYEQVRQRCS